MNAIPLSDVVEWRPHAHGQRDLLRIAVEQAAHGLMVLNEVGTILLTNREAEAILGFGPNELLYQNVDRVLPEASEWQSALCTTLSVTGRRKTGAAVPLETRSRVVTEGGQRYIVMSILEECVARRGDVAVFGSSQAIVAESDAVRSALADVEQVAPTPATVLLLGETGVGKEVFAQAIHDASPRRDRSMIHVSCAAMPSTLIESELFGRERGAFTGALARQIGRFEAAHQSTLFLDEIGELPADVQVKLLRVLQERVFERLGSTQSIKVDVRIIAATNRNLEQAVADKTFREDLYYRLNVFPIVVPPLRERREDIPGLVWAFIDEFSKSFGKPIDSIAKESLEELQAYHWPGNVRELRNVVERAVIVARGPRLTVRAPGTHVSSASSKAPLTSMSLEAHTVEHVRSVLESTNWRVRGVGGAAERLGLKPTTLESRMLRLGIRRQVAS